MKGKMLIVIAALALGGIAAFASYSYLGAIQRQAVAGSALVDVLVAKQDIPRGVAANDLLDAGYVETAKMPLKYVASGAISTVKSVADRIVSVPVTKGEVLTTARFEYSTDAGLAYAVPADFVAVTVPVDDARGVAGLVKPGDRVAILGTITGKAGADDTTRIMVKGAKVLAVGQSTTPQAPTQQTSSSGGAFGPAGSSSSQGAALKTVTVAVSAGDAEKIVLAIESGSIWLALLPGTASSVNPGPGQTTATVLK
jgi:pilus assembly protein CpaB